MIALIDGMFEVVAGMKPKRTLGTWAPEEVIIPEGALSRAPQ